MHSRPGCRAEMHYPATPGMAPRLPVHVSLTAAGSVTLLDLKVVSFGGLRMKKRSIICCWLEVLPGQGGRRPTVRMPGLCRRLQRMIAGSVAAGIGAIGPAGCGSSGEAGSTFHQGYLVSLLQFGFPGLMIDPPLVLLVLAPALGVALPAMVRGGDADLLSRRWGFHRGWTG